MLLREEGSCGRSLGGGPSRRGAEARPAPVDVFASGAAEYEARVAALIADDEDLVDYVGRLESLVDDETDEVTGELDPAIDADAVDPDEFVAEVERFLRDQGDD